jgi:hypothetical protein
MLKKIFLSLCFASMLSACSSLPELPDMPLIQDIPGIPGISDPEPNEEEGEGQEKEEEKLQYQSRGDGYLSFTYERGHLETITVEWGDEEIELSRGITVIKKVPVGPYEIDVSGAQKDLYAIETRLSYEGQTKAYSFTVPSPNSRESNPSVRNRSLAHSMGAVVVGSSLVEPSVKVTKLDAPAYVFKEIPNCVDNCTMVKSLQFVGPKNLLLPEGEYRISASEESKNVYIDGRTVSTIEVQLQGFSFESVVIEPSRSWRRVLTGLGL